MSATDFNRFLAWEATTRDTIDFKKAYVDMAGDLIAGLLLSQIVYWHLPNKHGDSKLRVKKDDKMWVAKKRTDWWDEIRISESQYDRASKILQEKGIIEVKLYKFNGAPMHHIRIISETFLSVFDQTMKSILNCDENGFEENTKNLTETTTENTTNREDFSVLPPTDNPLSISNMPSEPTNGGRDKIPRKDYLEAISEFAESQPTSRPKGWQDTSEAVFGICQHVARLWFAGRIPTGTWGDRIEKWCAGATELLSYHDGDIQATRATLDRYHAHYVENEMTLALAGPHSLINVVSQFMANESKSVASGPKVIKVGR